MFSFHIPARPLLVACLILAPVLGAGCVAPDSDPLPIGRLNGTAFTYDVTRSSIHVSEVGDSLTEWSQLTASSSRMGIRLNSDQDPGRDARPLSVGSETPLVPTMTGAITVGDRFYLCEEDGSMDEVAITLAHDSDGAVGRISYHFRALRPC